ncbi:hypothetical protein QE152_g1632 [Popillia japonica]|uniref:C2H2-type domain-containing protein n=1 Tax=Popillia japonica TaxID=7064 RepID=A0AAW1N7C0_POPJA
METRGKKILKLAGVTKVNNEKEARVNYKDTTKQYDKKEETIYLNEEKEPKKITVLQNISLNPLISPRSDDKSKLLTKVATENASTCKNSENMRITNILNTKELSFSDQSDVEDSIQDSDYVPETEVDSSSSAEIPYNNNTTFSYSPIVSPSAQLNINNNIGVIKKKRLWNKKDYCFYCDTEVMKFSRHILRHHSSEIEVQQIMALRTGDKRRKTLFTKLRNKGNFLKSTVDENIVPVRKPANGSQEKPNTSSYLPCKYCRGFYKRKYLFRHIKNCPHNTDDKKLRTNAQSDGQSLLTAYKRNDILTNEVFPVMKPDSISLTAKADPLICEVARRYLKSHREKQFRLVASRKMRQLASLLLEMRKKGNIRNMLSALDPSNFDSLVHCTKVISRYNPETQAYGAPSLAANMGTLLKECVDVANLMLMRKTGTKPDDLQKLKLLKDLIISEWRYEVSTLAISDLQQKKWNKPSLIPLAEDLALLKTYLNSSSDMLMKKLQEDCRDITAFKKLQELTYVQLILLNRRRVGELQRMTVSTYIDNINNQSSGEFDSCISESEKILMNSFKRVVIRGKRGRGVPVLFTDYMVKCTNLLLELRANFVQKENVHLFANLKSVNSINGSQVIYKIVRDAGVKNPLAITSTKLRKHLATMSQVINLSQQDLEQLASFMGHTSDIHKNYYRLPNDIYQTAKVSKLLLLSEKGQTSVFKGKALDEIDISLDIEEENDEDIINEEHMENLNENVEKGDVTSQSSQATEKPIYTTNKKVKRVLEPWTKEQKKVALEFFKNHINTKTAPKKAKKR